MLNDPYKSTEKLAYFLWELYGCPNGFSDYFWFKAESFIKQFYNLI